MKDSFQDPLWPIRVPVMSFRLTNALATFQVYIIKILTEKLNIFVIVYLNDILIYIKSEGKEHMEAIQ